MAITIGAFKIDFEANTQPLQDSKKMIQDWSAAVSRASKSTTAAGQERAKSWGRQEIAMKQAWIQMQRQLVTMRKLASEMPKGSAAQADMNKRINDATGVLRRYTVELTSGTLSQHQMARSAVALKNEMQKVAAATKRTQDAMSTGKFSKLTDTLRNLESASVLAVGPLSGIGARLRSLSAITSRTTLVMAGLLGTITGIIVGFYKLATASIRANAEMAQVEARLLAVSGSTIQVGKDIKYITELTMRMGLEFVGTAKSFSRFNAASMGTALEGDKAKKVFEGITKAGAALRLSGVEMEGIFRAVEQMMSKGTVQAEELRGQLGERLPGAFRLAAESMGVTTIELNKMLKSGDVLAEDMLPKLAQHLEDTFGARSEDNANTLRGAWNNLTTQFTLFANEVNDATGITDALVAAIKDLTIGMKALAENISLVIQAFEWLGRMQDRLHFTNMGLSISKLTNVAFAGFMVAIRETARDAGLLKSDTDKLAQSFFDAINPMERLKAAAEKVKETYRSLTSFSAGFQKSIVDGSGGIQELVDDMDQLNDAMALMAKGRKFETAMDEAAWAVKLVGSSTEDLFQVSRMLWNDYQIFAIPTAAEVARGLATMAERIRETTDSMEDGTKAADAYADAMFELGQLHKELAAAKQGQEAYDLYTKIVSKIEDQAQKLREAGVDEKLIGDNAADRLATMIALTAEQEKMAAAAKRHKDTQKAEVDLMKANAAAMKKQDTALTKANEAIDVMAMRIAAMASGPDSLEIFDKIQRPLAQFVFQLEQAGVAKADIVARAKEFEALLQEQLRLTGPIAKGMQDIADSMGDAMESLFTGAKTLKDTFKDMAEEIYKSLAHLLIIDPLVKQIGNSLTNTFTQGTNGQVPSILNMFKKNKSVPGAVSGTTANTTGVLKAGMNDPVIAKQMKVQDQFQDTIDNFDEAIEQFQTTLEMMQECVCKGSGSEGVEAMDSLFRSSMLLGDSSVGLDSASTELKNASYSLENTARSFEAAAMRDQQLAKADKWMKLIQTGVSAYGSMSSMGSASTLDAGGGTSSPGRTDFLLGARAFGGPTKGNGLYQVAENGPELYHEGNKSYLLAGNDGQVEPMRSGGSTTNITIVMPQQTTNRTAAQNARAIGKEQARVMGRNA